jgi:pimeloyl-ACP methyl ester carboxylesterase
MGEKRFSMQLQNSVTDGEPVWLEAENDEFFAIYDAAQAQQKQHRGGVILLHDLGAHADWPAVIHPLRVALRKAGWHVLSLQLPVYAGTSAKTLPAHIQVTHRRIKSAIAYLNGKRILNLVLAGHGFGAAAGLSFTAENQNTGVNALVVVGLYNANFATLNERNLRALTDITRPVLDIVGALESEAARDAARERLAVSGTAGNENYRQVFIIGNDQGFSRADFELADKISKWLKKHAPGMQMRINNTKGLRPDPPAKD